jgi:hypothetical protein
MRLFKYSSFAFLAFFFLSCRVSLDYDHGEFVVLNKSESAFLVITDVYLRSSGSSFWVNMWHGSCAGGKGAETELSFTARPGIYDVRIRVEQGFLFYSFYETGYRHPIKLGNGSFKFVVFDGNGIYDREGG